MTQTVLILGASGSAGHHAKQAFQTAGWTVRTFNRKTDTLPDAALGCDVILNAWNPANYHNWAGILPKITQSVIHAAQVSGALVVLPGNVYNFGVEPGPWSHETPQTACTRKGKVRKDIEAMYAAAGIRTIVLRAGDFVSSDGPANVIGKLILKDFHKGRITTLGDPDAPRAHAYLPDWARAVVALMDHADALPDFADISFPGHTFSTNDLKLELERTHGPLQLTQFPWWSMSLAAPFWELAREFREMRYLYDHPHQLDGSLFQRLLPDFQMSDFSTVARAELRTGQGQSLQLQTA